MRSLSLRGSAIQQLHRFSEALSLVAYTGVGGSREAFSTSPTYVAIRRDGFAEGEFC